MQGQHLFEYAVIRLVPRVEREEFLNVGVVLYCAGLKFLHTKYLLDEEKLKAFNCDADATELRDYLNAFERISGGMDNAGPIGRLPMAERFRWLTATRSTVVQTSKVHSGFCNDAAETLQKLFAQLVL